MTRVLKSRPPGMWSQNMARFHKWGDHVGAIVPVSTVGVGATMRYEFFRSIRLALGISFMWPTLERRTPCWPTGHHELPRTYFQICGMDILRDEDLIYEQVLREDNGVETRVDIYPGMPHIFWGSFSHLAQGRKAAIDLIKGSKRDGSNCGTLACLR